MPELVAIVFGTIGTFLALAASIWASRRFGLPGLAREVDKQQDQLISVLRENNLRLARDNRHLRAANKQLRLDNQDLRGKLALAYGDIAALYRAQGRKVPVHVLETIIELKDKENDTQQHDEDDDADRAEANA